MHAGANGKTRAAIRRLTKILAAQQILHRWCRPLFYGQPKSAGPFFRPATNQPFCFPSIVFSGFFAP
jgi:hypothetical protein